MASKKAGRLAGLAALAGLAYMNKDKLFGAKGETKAAETKADVKVAPNDRDDADRYLGFRAPIDDERPAPTGMGEATKLVAPAKVARSEKAPSAPVAKAPIIGGPTPARAPGGAAKRGGKSMDELMSSYKPRRPNTRLEDAELKDNTGKRIGRYEDDGGRSMAARQNVATEDEGLKRGGKVKKMASGGMTSSASKRADGIATKGKTRGRMC